LSSAGQVVHFANSLGEALEDLNESRDPIQRVMRSVKTFAEQDLELATRSANS
jgi:hypothetical protein